MAYSFFLGSDRIRISIKRIRSHLRHGTGQYHNVSHSIERVSNIIDKCADRFRVCSQGVHFFCILIRLGSNLFDIQYIIHPDCIGHNFLRQADTYFTFCKILVRTLRKYHQIVLDNL